MGRTFAGLATGATAAQLLEGLLNAYRAAGLRYRCAPDTAQRFERFDSPRSAGAMPS